MKGSSNIKIDSKFYRQHDYLIYCNDVLVRWLKWFDENKQCQVSIKFKNDMEMQDFQDKAEADIMWWLENNGYKDEMYELNRRHILCSLVADFCHYMLESFNCASKMKPAVAYALLRKPLRDNLAYVEWLRDDPKDLIDKLLHGTPEEYDLSHKKDVKRERINRIYEKYGIQRVQNMFEFRYEKNSEMSLERIWNKANHLVTTQNYTKSENGELNFVFVNMERWEQMTEYYYSVVPLVMSYAVELIVGMFEEIAGVNIFTQTINQIMLMLHQAYGSGDAYYVDAKKTLELDKCPMVCPYCGKTIELDGEIDRFLLNKYKCKSFKCRKKLNTSNYIFDFEKLNKYIEEDNR